jgi:hypothetical protein
MRAIASRLLALLCAALAACGSIGNKGGDYVGGSVAVECAPFARALTGMRLAVGVPGLSGGRNPRGATPARNNPKSAA